MTLHTHCESLFKKVSSDCLVLDNDMPRKYQDEKEDNDDHDDHSSLSSLTDNAPLSSSQGEGGDFITVAEQDACWDGCWFADGLHSMFLHLHRQSTPKDAVQQDDDNEYIRLDMDQEDQQGWERLHVQILGPRDLQIAAGIIRRISEGTCPAQLPIRALSNADWETFRGEQDAADRALAKKKYKKAIARYNQALQVVPKNFFVAPTEQIYEIANLLCNKAECYLQTQKYQKAGNAATASLLFVGNHETSRLHRAKAAMAMESTPYLIQAQMDLQEMLNNGEPSEEEEHQAEQALQKVGQLLRAKRTDFEKENPEASWQDWVDSVKAKCW